MHLDVVFHLPPHLVPLTMDHPFVGWFDKSSRTCGPILVSHQKRCLWSSSSRRSKHTSTLFFSPRVTANRWILCVKRSIRGTITLLTWTSSKWQKPCTKRTRKSRRSSAYRKKQLVKVQDSCSTMIDKSFRTACGLFSFGMWEIWHGTDRKGSVHGVDVVRLERM